MPITFKRNGIRSLNKDETKSRKIQAIVVAGILLFLLGTALYKTVRSNFTKDTRQEISLGRISSNLAAENSLDPSHPPHSEAKVRNLLSKIGNSSSTEEEEEPRIPDEDKHFLILAGRYNQMLGDKLIGMGGPIFEEIIDTENPDPAWQYHASREGDHYLKQSRFENTEIDQLVCSSSVCKIVFTHSNEEERRAFQDEATSDGPWGKGHQYGGSTEQFGQELGTFIYFSRNMDYEPFLRMREMAAKKLGYEVYPR